MVDRQGEQAVVNCGTTKGPLVMQFYRDWSPLGYDRAVELFERVRLGSSTMIGRRFANRLSL